MISTAHSAPVANAGPDQEVPIDSKVTLDGGKSTDFDGNFLTFKWSLTTRPSGSQAALSNPNAVMPTFTVDKPGAYVAQLIVNDGIVDSAPSTVSVVTQNARPVADAWPAQSAYVSGVVTLDGSKSYDLNGDLLTYKWSFASVPQGSSAAINGASLENPTFTVDKPGTYVAQLIVNDGMLSSIPATVTISTVNSAPIANAGPDQAASLNETVTLDGSKSYDSDGDALTFKWAILSRPAGSTSTLSDPSAVKPTLVIDQQGAYVLQVIVNDGSVNSAPSTVTIFVSEDPRPVANAGPGQTAHVTDTVTLDGSKSSDAAGNLLTYQWSFTSVPKGSTAALSDPTAVRPTFTIDLPGTYVVQLVVTDGIRSSTPATVSVLTVNSPPVANAGPDQTAYVNTLVTLDGGKSSDVDGDSLTYQWSFASVPTGSAATLAGPNTPNPTFTPDLPGTYVAQLIVNDGTVNSTPATVTISTSKSPPVANAGMKGKFKQTTLKSHRSGRCPFSF